MPSGVNRPRCSARRRSRAAQARAGPTPPRPHPNIAARLAALAKGGELMVSESTLSRLGATFPVDDLGLRELKNVERPMRLFRLAG